MQLKKRKLGELIELVEEKNESLEYGIEDVKGISIKKTFIDTKADMSGVSLKPYYLVRPDYFAYVTVTSRNGNKITLAHNNTDSVYIVSSSYVVFKIKNEHELLSSYLFMFFNRPEFDRYARFNSWGSARETFSWEEMCNVELLLPSYTVQRELVDIYQGLQKNLDALNSGILDMEDARDFLMDHIAHTSERKRIGLFIEETDSRNTDLTFTSKDVKGMTITKQIIPTKANMTGTALNNFKIVYPYEFVYNPRTHGKKIGLGFNNTGNPFIISWNNASFRIKPDCTRNLMPEYLYLCICRDEWDREACFHSWGSSTEVFSWDALCEMTIAVPDISIQRNMVNIYHAISKRIELRDRLMLLQKDICPVLINGATEEGSR